MSLTEESIDMFIGLSGLPCLSYRFWSSRCGARNVVLFVVMSRALVLSSARAALLKLNPVRFMLSNPYLCISLGCCRLSFIMLQEEDISL